MGQAEVHAGLVHGQAGQDRAVTEARTAIQLELHATVDALQDAHDLLVELDLEGLWQVIIRGGARLCDPAGWMMRPCGAGVVRFPAAVIGAPDEHPRVGWRVDRMKSVRVTTPVVVLKVVSSTFVPGRQRRSSIARRVGRAGNSHPCSSPGCDRRSPDSSKLGKQHQSMEPLVDTRAHECMAPMRP